MNDRKMVKKKPKTKETTPFCRQSSQLASILLLHIQNLACGTEQRLILSQQEGNHTVLELALLHNCE